MAGRHRGVPFGFAQAEDLRPAIITGSHDRDVNLVQRPACRVVDRAAGYPRLLTAEGLRRGVPECPVPAHPFEMRADDLASERLPHPVPDVCGAAGPFELTPGWP